MPMVVEFHDEAIVLSGETGTRLKCETLGGYYPIWWGITSGGDVKGHELPTAIVELNAGTGEDYIKERDEVILGSSGHAMQLKTGNPDAKNLKVILVEENTECYSRLKRVIARRWPSVNLTEAEGPSGANTTGVYLVNKKLPEALNGIESLQLGNSLFFFDPLLYTPWSEIERVAGKRIRTYYHTQTEFIVFLFTSDWFSGRKVLGLDPLPKGTSEASWSAEEKGSVAKMDQLFGSSSWRPLVLTGAGDEERIDGLVEAYRRRLHQWFRYVLPFPFQPKENQLYHLFMCSNYEEGIAITKRYYADASGNALLKMDSRLYYSIFKRLYPQTVRGLQGNGRPLVWKILWATIRNHDEGLCDILCRDFKRMEFDYGKRSAALAWLEAVGYFRKVPQLTDAWPDPPQLYALDWGVVKSRLGVDPPTKFVPLQPKNQPAGPTRAS